MSNSSIYQLNLVVDVKEFGQLNDPAKGVVREILYTALSRALKVAGIEPADVRTEDRGDGFLVTTAGTAPVLIAGTWLDAMHEELRRVNADRRTPIRLRIAMTAGPVGRDRYGLLGKALELAFRLCDSPTSKAVLNATDEPIVFVVSQGLYEDVIQHGGHHVDPRHYRSAPVHSKETAVEAWFHVPGLATPPIPLASDDSPGPAPAAPGDAGPAGPVGPADQASGAAPWFGGDGANTVVSGGTFQGPTTIGHHYSGGEQR